MNFPMLSFGKKKHEFSYLFYTFVVGGNHNHCGVKSISSLKMALGSIWSCGNLLKSISSIELLIKVLIKCLNFFKYVIWIHNSISTYCIE